MMNEAREQDCNRWRLPYKLILSDILVFKTSHHQSPLRVQGYIVQITEACVYIDILIY